MPVPLDPNQLNLLSQLCKVLQNPITPTLLQWLTEQASFSSNPYSISRSISLSRTDPTPELEPVVETFRGGNTMKMNMITSILGILEDNTNVSISQSQKEATFNSYLTEILSIQSTFNDSRGPDPSGTEPIQPPIKSGEVDARRTSKRSWDVENPVSDDKDDKPSKKQKLLESNVILRWHLCNKLWYWASLHWLYCKSTILLNWGSNSGNL